MRSFQVTVYFRSLQLLTRYIYTYLIAVHKNLYVYACLLNWQNLFKRKSCLPPANTCSNRQTHKRSSPLIMDIFHAETCLPKQGSTCKTRYKFSRISNCHNSTRSNNPDKERERVNLRTSVTISVPLLGHLQFPLPHGSLYPGLVLMILSCYIS